MNRFVASKGRHVRHEARGWRNGSVTVERFHGGHLVGLRDYKQLTGGLRTLAERYERAGWRVTELND